MNHMMWDQIRVEMQKMVGLSQRLMHAVNYRGDEGLLLPRNPSSSSSCASTSASYQAPSSSTRPPFSIALHVPQSSPFYTAGTCFFILVCTTCFLFDA